MYNILRILFLIPITFPFKGTLIYFLKTKIATLGSCIYLFSCFVCLFLLFLLLLLLLLLCLCLGAHIRVKATMWSQKPKAKQKDQQWKVLFAFLWHFAAEKKVKSAGMRCGMSWPRILLQGLPLHPPLSSARIPFNSHGSWGEGGRKTCFILKSTTAKKKCGKKLNKKPNSFYTDSSELPHNWNEFVSCRHTNTSAQIHPYI